MTALNKEKALVGAFSGHCVLRTLCGPSLTALFQVSSKGSLTGGYFNKSRSRLEIQKTRTDKNNEIISKEAEMKTLRDDLAKVEADINKVVAEMQKTENKNSRAKDIFEKVKTDMRLMKEELSLIDRNHGGKERSLIQLKASLEAMQTTKEGLESELNQDLMATLSTRDQAEVDQLNDDIRRLKTDNKKAFSERMRLEAQKNKLENLLTNNLIRRKDELVQALQEISVEDRHQQLENCVSDLKSLEERLDVTKGNMKGLDKNLQDVIKKRKKYQAELEASRLREREIQDKIEEDAKELERMASKQTVLQQKIQECTKKIRELGSLPSDAFEKYKSMSQKQLFKQLEKANQELKKYSHVNKKALDQYVSFSEQKEKLIKRKEELDKGHKKIQDLMEVLEQRKFEAILFTFKQVSKYFQEVFEKLVPGGRGTLSIKSDDSRDDDDQVGLIFSIGVRKLYTSILTLSTPPLYGSEVFLPRGEDPCVLYYWIYQHLINCRPADWKTPRECRAPSASRGKTPR